jgi:hypothetical protein
MRVTAARLNCAPVRSLKVSADLGGCAVTMRCTSVSSSITSSAAQFVTSMKRIYLPWWVISERDPYGASSRWLRREHPQADIPCVRIGKMWIPRQANCLPKAATASSLFRYTANTLSRLVR